jgi:hypothetical protein
MKLLLPLFIVQFLFIACSSKQTREEFKKQQSASPIHHKSYWKKWEKLPLEDRVTEITPEMIKYLQGDNDYNGFPNRPKRIQLTDKERKIIKLALKSLPQWLKGPIEKKLTGVMILDDLGGSGMADWVKFYKNHGFVVFDIKVLRKKANDWCTWKEGSPFKEGDYQLKCIIEKKGEDNAISAFRYIFLHEAAHILTIGTNIMPFWSTPLKSQEEVNQHAFLRLDWKFDKEKRYIQKEKYKYIEKIPYYLPSKARENKSMLKTYKELKGSNFATLYASTNPWDDLAETYVNYLHTQVFKRPFEIQILKEEKVVYSYKDCWGEKRCRKKKKLIQKFLIKN